VSKEYRQSRDYAVDDDLEVMTLIVCSSDLIHDDSQSHLLLCTRGMIVVTIGM
jgi:hypothetical protein